LTIANFKRWTNRELDLRREAASAVRARRGDEGLRGLLRPVGRLGPDQRPRADDRVDRRHQDQRRRRAQAAGHDLPQLASRLVLAFLTQAISGGFFHADMHQGNLFVRPDGTIVAIDFGIMGRIDRRARQWLARSSTA
jgi:ubiquinone biosynthesis protein